MEEEIVKNSRPINKYSILSRLATVFLLSAVLLTGLSPVCAAEGFDHAKAGAAVSGTLAGSDPAGTSPGTKPGSNASGTDYGTDGSGSNVVASDVPGTGDSGTDVPGADNPGTGAPDTGAPSTDVPGSDDPGSQDPSQEPDPWTPEDGLPSLAKVKFVITGDNQIIVKWKLENKSQDAEIFQGYEVSYARNVLFLRSKMMTVEGGGSNNVTLDGLDTTKRYYLRVRGYREYNGDRYCSDWVQTKTGKNSADASVKYMKTNGSKVDIRRQAGKKLKDYSIAQGSCSDGTYLYMAFEKRNGDDNGKTRARIKIAKVRISDWKLKKVSASGQKLGHANDITYNSNKDILVVTGAKTNDPYVRIVSPKTLKKTDTKMVRLLDPYKSVKAFNAIDYDPESRTYYIRSRFYGGKCFTLNEKFRQMNMAVMSTVFPSRHVQSCTSMGNIFIIPQSWYQSTGKNTITIFDKAGTQLQHIKLKLSGELESLFFIGEELYATVHKHVSRSYKTCFIFRILL